MAKRIFHIPPHLSASDWAVGIMFGLLFGLLLVALPPLVLSWSETAQPRPAIFYTLEAVLAVIGLSAGTLVSFRHKPAITATTERLQFRYPFRMFWPVERFPLPEIDQVRLGERRNDWWCRVFLHPRPARRDVYEFRLDLTEEQAQLFVRELESIGITAHLFEEI